MLYAVKKSLRIKSDKLDDEIIDLIDAAMMDLSVSGVKKLDDTDPLVRRAIIVYCKANFGLDNKDSEKYQKSFDIIKERLSLCGEYNVVE